MPYRVCAGFSYSMGGYGVRAEVSLMGQVLEYRRREPKVGLLMHIRGVPYSTVWFDGSGAANRTIRLCGSRPGSCWRLLTVGYCLRTADMLYIAVG